MKKENLKRESVLKNKIKEMKKTSRGKAILKLIGWVIFFFIIFIFCVVASLIKTPNSEKANNRANVQDVIEQATGDENITIPMLLEELLISNYNYEYKITINDATYIFNGKKENNIEQGYKESSNGIIKYYIDDTGIYQETTNEKILIIDLYENIDATYLNLSNIITTIENLELSDTEALEVLYPTYYAKDNVNSYYVSFVLRVSEENNHVKSIIIKALDNSYEYNLNFDNIEVQQ